MIPYFLPTFVDFLHKTFFYFFAQNLRKSSYIFPNKVTKTDLEIPNFYAKFVGYFEK